MRAPIMDFSDQTENGSLAVYICKNALDDDLCEAQICRATDVRFVNMNTVSVMDDHTINIYDEQTNSVISSGKLIKGTKIYCLKCNKIVGTRSDDSLIVFDSSKLGETIIYNFNRFVESIIESVLSSDEQPLVRNVER